MSNDSAARDELRSKVEALIADLELSGKKIRESNELGAIRSLGKCFEDYAAELKEALSRQSAQGAEAVAYRYRLHDQPLGHGWSYATTLQDDEYEYRLDQDPCVECLEPLVPRAELEQYRKDAESLLGALKLARDELVELKNSVGFRAYTLTVIQASSEAIDRAMQEGK